MRSWQRLHIENAEAADLREQRNHLSLNNICVIVGPFYRLDCTARQNGEYMYIHTGRQPTKVEPFQATRASAASCEGPIVAPSD
eukprot:44315-Amphidinium_carterae.1